MAKGDETRQAILDRAFALANVGGLAGVTIGRLAEETSMSKSGLFSHFGSKEALDVAIVEEAGRRFVQAVMVPALGQPRGEPRIRALFDRWLAWGQRPGGCFFVGASAELDDKQGPARDALSRACKDWIDMLATAARIAVEEKHFRADLEPAQFAFELYGVMVGAHTFIRFLRDPSALERARTAFDNLVSAARR